METWQILLIIIASLIIFILVMHITILNITFTLVFGRIRIDRKVFNGALFGSRWVDYIGNLELINSRYERKDHEEIDIYNGNIRLHGYFYEKKNSDKVIIFVHGYYSSGLKDIGVQADIYEELGASILIVDQRACGKSGGLYTTFGIKERYDIREWIFYLDERFKGKKEIYLSGISMGAATVLLTSGLSGLPPSLKGIIADSGYSRPSGITLHTGKKIIKFRAKHLFLGLNLYCKIFAGFSMNETTVTKACKKNSKIPVLFIHGTGDAFVPYNMTVKNYKACNAPKKLIRVEEAGHCESMRYAPDLVYPAIREFIYGK